MISETLSVSLQKTKFELAGDENWKRLQVNEEFVGLVLCCRFDELNFDSLQSDFSNFLLFCV